MYPQFSIWHRSSTKACTEGLPDLWGLGLGQSSKALGQILGTQAIHGLSVHEIWSDAVAVVNQEAGEIRSNYVKFLEIVANWDALKAFSGVLRQWPLTRHTSPPASKGKAWWSWSRPSREKITGVLYWILMSWMMLFFDPRTSVWDFASLCSRCTVLQKAPCVSITDMLDVNH